MPSVSTYDPTADAELVRRIRAGDDSAFDALVRAYYAGLLQYLASTVRAQDVAEELLHDLFLRLWKRRHTLPEDITVRAYLYGAAHHHVLDHRRSVRRRDRAYDAVSRGVPDQSSEAAPWDTLAMLEQNELREALHAAAETLPERCRDVWRLSREHGLSYSEIAHAMGISINTVKTQMGRALGVLREAAKPFFLLLVLVHR